MSYTDHPIIFDCGDDTLVGIVSAPENVSTTTGVLIVVGGPQYRAGSHRQFVHLSRSLAEQGFYCMRFDYRGMGDATGAPKDFDNIDADICAAFDAFFQHAPGLKHIVLWGLCDAASASCFYAPRDERLAGLVLVNPWVRTESSEATTYLKHYYLRRLFSAAFWRKLLSGTVNVSVATSELLGAARKSRSSIRSQTSKNRPPHATLPARMAAHLRAANLPLLLILSGRDYVANEFELMTKSSADWSQLLQHAKIERLETADHTFSQVEWRKAAAAATIKWLGNLDTKGEDDA